MIKQKIGALILALCTTIGIVLFVAPSSAQASPGCVFKNDATAARGTATTMRIDSYNDNVFLGTFFQSPGTQATYPCGTNDSRWSIASTRRCTWHPAGGTQRTYTGPISVFLTDNTIIDRCVAV
jgi:hypothetical protein